MLRPDYWVPNDRVVGGDQTLSFDGFPDVADGLNSGML